MELGPARAFFASRMAVYWKSISRGDCIDLASGEAHGSLPFQIRRDPFLVWKIHLAPRFRCVLVFAPRVSAVAMSSDLFREKPYFPLPSPAT